MQEREEALNKAREQVAQLTIEYETSSSELVLAKTELAAARASEVQLTAVKKLATSLGSNVQQLRADHDLLAATVRQSLAVEFKHLLTCASEAIATSTQSALEEATLDLRAKYRFEFRQRKLLYNKLQELQGQSADSNLSFWPMCPQTTFARQHSCILPYPL